MIPRVVARLAPGVARVEVRRGRRVQWTAEASWSTPDDLAMAMAELAGECALPRLFRSLRVYLDDPLIQLRRLEGLPRVRGGALPALLALTPQRYFRRNGSPLVVDGCWTNPRRREIALAVAAPLPLVAAIVRGGREGGFAIDGIHPASPAAGGRLQLLPPDERSRRDARALRWTRRLGVAAAVGWITLGAAMITRDLVDRRRVEARLAELRAPIDALLASQAASDSAAAMVAQLEEDAHMEGSTVTTLLRIAAAVPDSAFLTQIRIDSAGVGLVSGAARRPATVLASLERQAGVRAPRFDGRTTPDLIGGLPVERFAIDFGRTEERQ